MHFGRKIYFGSNVSDARHQTYTLNDCEALLVAYNLDPSNEQVKSELSRVISRAAMMYYRKKIYGQAAYYAQKALDVNENNPVARPLLDHLKRKHPTEI